MKLKLLRYSTSVESTLGILFIDDKFECYTVEDTYREKKIAGEQKRATDKGWLPKTSISGKQESPPQSEEAKQNAIKDLQNQSIMRRTGDAMVDVASIFANQYLITRLNKQISILINSSMNLR